MVFEASTSYGEADDQILRALAEQLKQPLMHISQAAELARSGSVLDIRHIETVADMGLRLIDDYLLSRELRAPQLELALEPVSVSSVLQAAAERLSGIAKEYGCEIELDIAGRFTPVLGHRQALESAITSLGYAFIEAATADEPSTKSRLVLAAHRSKRGIVAGAYGDYPELSQDMFKRARVLCGQARQAIPSLGSSSGAGIFVAESLFDAISTKLYVAHHNKLTGLAAVLPITPQLQLVGV